MFWADHRRNMDDREYRRHFLHASRRRLAAVLDDVRCTLLDRLTCLLFGHQPNTARCDPAACINCGRTV